MIPDDAKKVLCAMSGGVDSSVAASLLASSGHEVTGMTMLLFGHSVIGEELESACCSLDDVEDAKQVCRRLGIPHYTFNFKGRFKEDVIDRFCDAYVHGRTPNPCIDCNRYLKFQALQRRRRELGMDYVATGHYARRTFDEESGRWQLRRGLDPDKDQSYVLYHLTQGDLEHMLFPLGSLSKEEVRAIADTEGFANAQKAESQDICFVPDGDYASFIRMYVESGGDVRRWEDGAARPDDPEGSLGDDRECMAQVDAATNPSVLRGSLDSALRDSLHSAFHEGDIVDESGHRLGAHNGLIHYTIGQRKGIGVAAPNPLYVKRKDIEGNRLIVSGRARLLVDTVMLEDVNIISGEPPVGITEVEVKLSYRQTPASATFEMTSEDTATVRLHDPRVMPASGQSVVAYMGDVVLGGGIVA